MPGTAPRPSQHIGYREATALGVGGIIGAGIFVLSGTASGAAGPAVVLSFAIAFVASLILSLCYAELSSMHDDSGGPYAYAKRHLPEVVATLVGWANWGAWMCASAYVGIGAGSYLHLLLPGISQPVGSVLVIAVFTVLNLFGIHFSGRVQFLILILEVSLLLAFIAVGLVHVDPHRFVPFMPNGTAGVLAAALIGFLSLTGWDAVVVSAEEIRNPRRVIPLAILSSLGVSFLLYAGLLLVEDGVIPWFKLGQSNTPVADVSRVFLGTYGPMVLDGIVLVALFAATNSNLIVISRSALVLARDGLAPRVLDRRFGREHVPIVAVLLAGVAQAGMSVWSNTRFAVSATGFLYTLTFVSSIIALFLARRRGIRAEFRTPLYPIVPIVALALCLVFLVSAGIPGVISGSCWLLVGLAYWWRQRRVVATHRPYDGHARLIGESVDG
jgi:APA family basic amino acid/polyamine antiporter/amino acid efflux transporter